MADKKSVLKNVFGFDSFRPGQEAIVDDLTEGRHVLAVMPTGSGKSLCYQVPALVKAGVAVGIGSAAIVSALLYASKVKKPKKSGGSGTPPHTD